MERWKGKVAIVTGASSGIGAAVAQALVRHGMVVVGFARRVDRIKQLADQLSQAGEPGKLHAVKTDLGKEEDIVAAFGWVEKELDGPDVLVNNAGAFNFSTIEEGSYEEWKTILDVNILGTTTCTREYLRSIKKHSKEVGHIFVINSVVGKLIIGRPMYTASKHALLALSQCLRKTLADKGSRIKVTDICPGYTKTEILAGTVYAEVFDKYPSMAAQDVAIALVSALSASPVTEICEIVMNPIPTNAAVY